MKNILKYQLPPVLWILAIYLVSSLPNLHLNLRLPLGADKIAHAFVYFGLCWLAWRAFFYQNIFPLLKKSALLGAFIFCCVYGILDEFHQRFVPGRSTDLKDVIAGAGGALLYVAIASMVRVWRNSKGSEPES